MVYIQVLETIQAYGTTVLARQVLFSLNTNSSGSYIPLSVYSESSYSFIADFAPKAGQTFMMMESYSPGSQSMASRHQQWVTMFNIYQGIGRIKFAPATASVTIQPNSEFVLYKYRES